MSISQKFTWPTLSELRIIYCMYRTVSEYDWISIYWKSIRSVPYFHCVNIISKIERVKSFKYMELFLKYFEITDYSNNFRPFMGLNRVRKPVQWKSYMGTCFNTKRVFGAFNFKWKGHKMGYLYGCTDTILWWKYKVAGIQ